MILCSTSMGLAQADPAKPKEVTHEPKRSIEFGFEERFRSERWNNLVANSALNDERQQFRFRTRTWVTIPLLKETTFAVGVVNEFKKQTTPDVNFNSDEVLFETLYVDCGKLFVSGLSGRVGRQNLSRGEGFVLMDGTPGDGSRTLYSNAAVVAYARAKSKIELMVIDNPQQDRYLPKGNDLKKQLNEWETRALGLYFTGRQRKSVDVDAYYFYAEELNDYRAASSAQYQPDREVQVLGARMVKRFARGITAAGELAGQRGAQDPNVAIRAWGGYGWVKKEFERPGKPYVLGGYWAMSGDDPRTAGTNEGWDPLFSRWPKWSDMYIYSLTAEKGASYWSNIAMWQAETGASPWKRVSLRGTVYGMSAQYARPGGVFGWGTGRGVLAQARADVHVNERLKGHLLYERLWPGDFYAGTAPGYFLRGEITWTMRWKVPRSSAR